MAGTHGSQPADITISSHFLARAVTLQVWGGMSIARSLVQHPRPRTLTLLRKLGTVVRIGLPIGILALLWSLADGPEVIRLLARADWGWLFAAYVAANLQIVFSALRWQLTARALDQSIPTGRAVLEYYLSQLLNLTLPSGILGDAGRAVRMRHQAGMVRATQAVLIERMAGQIALFVVLAIGLAALPFFVDLSAMPAWVRHALRTGVVALVAAVVVFAVMGIVPGPVSRALKGFAAASVQALCAPGIWQKQVLLSTLTVACNVATITFAARATGTDMTMIAVLTVPALMLTAMLLPVSAGGWGLREGAAAALWPLMGGTATAGVAASVTFGLVILAASLPGLAMLIGPQRWRAALPSPSL